MKPTVAARHASPIIVTKEYLTAVKKGMDAVVNDEILGEGIAIGLRKDDPVLLEAINRALAAMHKDGTYDSIQKKYFTFDIYN